MDEEEDTVFGLLDDVAREEQEEWQALLDEWPESSREIYLRMMTKAGMPDAKVRLRGRAEEALRAASVKRTSSFSSYVDGEGEGEGEGIMLRTAVWKLLLLHPSSAFVTALPSDANSAAKREDLYRKLLERGPDEITAGKIEKDLHRSAPYSDERQLLTEEVMGQLRRILFAYAVYDKDLRYCQGLNFVGFMLLLHLDEVDAFWALVSLLYGFNLRLMYSSSSELLPELLRILTNEIKERFPKLDRHFESQDIAVTMYAMDWLTTFFVYSLHLETNQRVWDILLAKGYEELNSAVYWLFQVSLAAIRLCHDQLLEWSLEEIMQGFKKLVVAIPPNAILSIAIDYELSTETQQQLEALIGKSKKCVIM